MSRNFSTDPIVRSVGFGIWASVGWEEDHADFNDVSNALQTILLDKDNKYANLQSIKDKFPLYSSPLGIHNPALEDITELARTCGLVERIYNTPPGTRRYTVTMSRRNLRKYSEEIENPDVAEFVTAFANEYDKIFA